MARFNTSRKRAQRYRLAQRAAELLAEGVPPTRTADGKFSYVIDGRHYVLPDEYSAQAAALLREDGDR